MNKNLNVCPPWYALRRKLKCTIGNDLGITVSNLLPIDIKKYKINIYVKDYSVSKALRVITPPVYNFGNICVYVYIYNGANSLVKRNISMHYTPKEVGDLFEQALVNNNLFKDVILTDNLPYYVKKFVGQVAVIIKTSIIQFYNDDLSDLFLNYNELANIVFKEILITDFPKDIKVNFFLENNRCCE